jgi:Peptidase A4 family
MPNVLRLAASAAAALTALLVPAAANASTAAEHVNHNWSGYVATSSSDVVIATVDFTVPTVQCLREGQGSMWAGIGGGLPGTGTSGPHGTWLEQAGVITLCAGRGAHPYDQPFWETITNTQPPPHTFPDMTIDAGDNVQAAVYAPAADEAHPHEWLFVLSDLNHRTGKLTVRTAYASLPTNDHARTGEAITEYPTAALSFPLMTVKYTDALYATTNSGEEAIPTSHGQAYELQSRGVTVYASAPTSPAPDEPRDAFSTVTLTD